MTLQHPPLASEAHGITQHGTPFGTQSSSSRIERFRARFPQRYGKPTASSAAPVVTTPESMTVDSVTEVEAPTSVDLPVTGRVIRLPELIQLVGLSRSAIYYRSSPKSPRFDPTFPKRIHLGPRTVAWLEAEVLAWIQSRAAARSDE